MYNHNQSSNTSNQSNTKVLTKLKAQRHTHTDSTRAAVRREKLTT